MADLGLLAGVLLASGTGLVGAAVYGLRSHRKAVKEPLGSVACGMPSPDYSLFCVGEIGHDGWCHHEATEWHDDVWAVDHWADTQQAPLCSPSCRCRTCRCSAQDFTSTALGRKKGTSPMRSIKFATVCALAAPALALGVAPAASALGASFDPGHGPAVTVGSGATADVGDNNIGLAVSIFGNASVTATGDGQNNRLVAIGSDIVVDGSSGQNNVITLGGGKTVVSGTGGGHNIVNVGGVTTVSSGATNVNSIAVCGTSFTGQAAHVIVSHGVC